MKKILHIILIFLFSLTIISCGEKDEYKSWEKKGNTTTTTDNTTTSTDTTAPTLAEVTAVPTLTNDTTPDIPSVPRRQEPSHMEVPVLQVPLLQPLTIIPSPSVLWTTELIRIVQLKLPILL